MKAMIKVANDVRGVYESGETEVVFCTRSLILWGSLFCLFRKKAGVDPLYYCLDRALGNKLPAEAQAGLHEMVQRVFGKTEKNKGAQK